ncbi:MAG: hypothetical protein WBP42_11540 [Candidatus Zixiibacteriota bacterium]
MKLEELRGVKFPITFGADGRLLMSSGEQLLKESIAQVLMTQIGELPFWPSFGSEIPRRLFTPVNRVAMLQADATEAVNLWCKHVDLISVKPVNTQKFSGGQMGYAVTFRHRGNSQTQTITIGQR